MLTKLLIDVQAHVCMREMRSNSFNFGKHFGSVCMISIQFNLIQFKKL